MDPRIDIHEAVSRYPKVVKKFARNKSICALLALRGIKPFCTKWGHLDHNLYNLEMLRHWQKTLFFNLYKQGEEFRNGPYGVLLSHRLEIAELYGSSLLTSRLPLEMIEFVLEYMI